MHQNYIFVKDYERKGKTYWKCTEYRTNKCRGRAHILLGEVIYHKEEHNHLPQSLETEVRKTINNIRKKASTDLTSSSRHILSEAIGVQTEAVSTALPSTPALKKTIQRVRKSKSNILPTPSTLRELILPHPYTVTLRNEQFLLFDSGVDDKERILLFSTKYNLKLLSETESHWFVDGTFKSTPHLFTQLLTIHILKFNTTIPLVYALLPNKNKNTYKRLLTELKKIQTNVEPSTVMMDFETALHISFQEIFENTRIKGCFFHFCQSVWRHIQTIHEVRQKYIEDTMFALNLRQLLALAFVPTQDVVKYFNELLTQNFYVENMNLLQPLINYFEDTWIGYPYRHNQRKNPKFHLQYWNQYENVLDDLPKTNNNIEGWHKAFSTLLAANHPIIWKFIDTLKKEQNLNEVKINQYIAGQPPPKRRRIYIQTEAKIKNIVLEYNKRTSSQYLIGIAHNFQLQTDM